jgi:hypothetical protein
LDVCYAKWFAGHDNSSIESIPIYLLWYIILMVYDIEFTEEFRLWYEETLSASEQLDVARVVEMLERSGPTLPFPYSSGIQGSRFNHMRELRIQHDGRPYRVLYAFDPRRTALLLLGGDKTGDERWYERMIPKADALYESHLRELTKK